MKIPRKCHSHEASLHEAPRRRKKKRSRANNNKTNATYVTTDLHIEVTFNSICLAFCFCLCFLLFKHMRRRPKGLVSKLCGTAHVSLPSNQSGNKQFVCSLSGSQSMWQINLYLPGPTGKIRYQNPVPKFER